MGDKKKMAKALFPLMYGWEWSKSERKEKWKDLRSNMEKMWDQYQDMQKSAKDAMKDQWEKFFPRLLEMEQTFADSLPDEKASLPGMPTAPMSPKEFVEKVKEFQEMANKYAVEQSDNAFDFCVQGQQQVKDVVTDAVDTIESDLDEKED